MKVRFTEEQKLTQSWLIWVILLLVALPTTVEIYRYLASPNQAPGNSFWIPIAVVSAVLLLFFSMKLKTEIDEEGIRLRYFPFTAKKVKWEEVEEAHVVNYGFVGGWGIRIWTSYGTVYNVKGTKGLAVTLKNGKKFLIGTQKEKELQQLIENLRP